MNCMEIQDLLAEDVEVAARNSEIQEHVKDCASCLKLLGRLHEVNAALSSMPEVSVPQAVIWKTIDTVEAKKAKPFRRLKLSLAAGIPVILLLMISLPFGASDEIRVLFATSSEALSGQEAPPPPVDPASLHRYTSRNGLEKESPTTPLGVDGHEHLVDSPVVGDETDTDTWNRKYVPPGSHATIETLLCGERVKALKKRRDGKIQVIRLPAGSNIRKNEETKDGSKIAGLDEKKKSTEFGVEKKTKELDAVKLPQVKLIENTDEGDTYTKPDLAKQLEDKFILLDSSDSTTLTRNDEDSGVDKNRLRMLIAADKTIQAQSGKRKTDAKVRTGPAETTVSARPGWWTDVGRDSDELPLDELEFIPARGYFANTYLPGDPSMVWLRRKLEKKISLHGRELILERACAPCLQPFDAPSADGLDVFLNTDRPAVDGPTRLTLQVGLKGSLRHAKRRAPLNAAIVIDLRAVPPEQHRRMLWMVADAVANNQQAGDQFSLVVAGVKNPLRVKPDRFDMVTVRRNLAQALHDMEKSGGVESLQAAMEVAYNKVGGEGANDAPLGAKLVLLVTAAPVGSGLEALQSLAHRQALLGINLTSIGVGSEADMDALGALAMADQGRRRLIVDANLTRTTVEAELSASGRVVARALRLRIRLGAGVKLIEILGSHPLNAARTERVRESEQATDQRVAKTLGIEADRGEDEDGIQIVIPAYYAGDDHVILLDVMVPGPGKVADVRLRYKDLVRLRNSVASASLNLDARSRPDNPLTRNVQKNLLAYRLSEDLLQAARQLEKDHFDRVLRTLAKSTGRIVRLQGRFPELRSDPELGKDLYMLAEYLDVLRDHQNWQHDRQVQVHLIRSLAYAGKTKLPPRVSHIPPVP